MPARVVDDVADFARHAHLPHHLLQRLRPRHSVALLQVGGELNSGGGLCRHACAAQGYGGMVQQNNARRKQQDEGAERQPKIEVQIARPNIERLTHAFFLADPD